MTLAEFQQQYASALDEQQQAAVAADRGPILLLAVPGSGKTTVLVTRIACLIAVRGVAPEQILTVTYTVSAAGDMRRRFAAQFGQELADRLAFRTINGLCSTVIRRYERMLGRRAFALLDDTGRQAALIGEIYREKTGEFAAENTIKTIQTAITYVKNRMIAPEDLKDVDLDGTEFPPIFEAYNRALRDLELMDYDDQLVYAYRILRQYPQVLASFQEQYAYVCVDEAQDTSRIQHAILNLLAGRSGNLFLVGDEDQSIYGFRAADPAALLHFEETHPGAKILMMEQNYRSTPPIVAAADRFIRANRDRRPKEMHAVREGSVPIREIPVRSRRDQYRHLLRLAAGDVGDTAVLYRDNDSALPLIDLFARRGLPYRCRQVDATFFSHRIVRDFTDIVCFARHPDDGERFLRIYYKLGAGISKAAAEEAAGRCSGTGQPILQALSESEAVSPWTRRQCKALQTHMNNLLEEGASRAVYRVQHYMGYGDYLEQRGADASKLQILEALGESESTPEGLLDRLETLREIVRGGGGGEGLLLSTIHSSKGLEYDRVILMDVADGLFPKTLPGSDAKPEELEALEEERRLFYVALTRAREELEIFRFRDPALSSSFSDALFPRKKPVAPVPAKDPAAVEQEAAAYVPGVRLRHRVFGPGVLTARHGDLVTVQLETGQEKRFSLSTALRSGQFRLQED